MKFNYSVLLFVSAIFAQPQSQKDSEDMECYTKMECKLSELSEKMKTDENFMVCAKFIDDKKAMIRCIYKVAGLRDDQINLLFNIIFSSSNCGPSSRPQFKECISKCASDKPCMETCADKRNESNFECLADEFEVKDFDVKKSVQCSKQCTQDTLSEIMDCDMKCKEPIYKKLMDDNDDNHMTESDKDSKSNGNNTSTTTATSSKDSKPTGGSSTTTQQSSGFSNLSASLVSVISVPILLSLIL
ncbi:hypothetical protein CONCODRAFT_10792 [Conidiobolus coronatus NRRL 28638]|uniref:Extracellular membrane protein CFEM domain-containing protein n=1 Tax=Conidiobolus coronatus (strain ATCC 28846 / CBS 209.66 / NRRL 28638) TaxID=796925 RepID=A0A137NX28_CONC2|nr:hypothetical protein CONCODRAFT_10792 [Conidiobolus coronatus NRRL 28638]|eukprot:KXN67194.1 hypothetical protein CONCODRAFT_10792 [Conidiobolus coronatus NRRL 28638]